jgi:hypothetical protein
MDIDAIKARGEAMVDHVKNRGGAVLKNGAWDLMVQTGGTDIPYLISEIECLKEELDTLRYKSSWINDVDRQGGSFTDEEIMRDLNNRY